MIAALIVAAAVTTFSIGGARPSAHQLSAAVAAAVRGKLLAELNAHRRAAGIRPLGSDAIAQAAAQIQADDMAATDVFGHGDAYGRLPMTRYETLGGTARFYGENVGWYGARVTQLDAVWRAVAELDSQMMAERPPNDGHRRNILAARFEAVGIAFAIGPHGLYFAEDFVGYLR